MSEHLPECYWPELPERAICICDRLRACEQRVRSEWALKVVDAKKEGFAEGIKEGRRRTSSETKTEMKQSYQEGVAVGRAAGLDAAEAAVAGMVIETVGNSAATVEQAITVIHALKVQP